MKEKLETAKYYLPTLTGYLDNEYSICREERQYALFLYNYICAQSDEMKEALFYDKNIIIEKVFYEATFMRDFFERDRRLTYLNGAKGDDLKEKEESKILQKGAPKASNKNLDESRFNRKLWNYMRGLLAGDITEISLHGLYGIERKELYPLNEEQIKSLIDVNLGSVEGQRLLGGIYGEGNEILTLARVLMNSKPDIAVIYRKGDGKSDSEEKELYLQFFECKFESEESTTKGGYVIKQTAAQDAIAHFLVSEYGVAKHFEASRVIRFVRKEVSGEETCIQIGKLIEHHNQLFGKMFGESKEQQNT